MSVTMYGGTIAVVRVVETRRAVSGCKIYMGSPLVKRLCSVQLHAREARKQGSGH